MAEDAEDSSETNSTTKSAKNLLASLNMANNIGVDEGNGGNNEIV